MAQAERTTDHQTIRAWVEERGGAPTIVETGGDGGILRINFEEPGGDDDAALTPVEWDEFFQIFEDSELAFLYQSESADGQTSRFNKFVRRTEDDA